MAQAILNPVNHVPDPAVRGFRKYCIVHNSFQMSDYEYMNDLYEFSGFERVVQSKLRLDVISHNIVEMVEDRWVNPPFTHPSRDYFNISSQLDDRSDDVKLSALLAFPEFNTRFCLSTCLLPMTYCKTDMIIYDRSVEVVFNRPIKTIRFDYA